MLPTDGEAMSFYHGGDLVSLARLATESGGRYTERTNDLALGFARAQRDLACTYSLGFYDDDPVEDRAKNVAVRVRRAGLRALHPSAYAFRSASVRRESLLRAAYLSPDSFRSGNLRAHLFPLRPITTDSWQALLAISFPVPLGAAGSSTADRDFGVVLQNASGVVHRFQRRIRLEAEKAKVASSHAVTFMEPVTLPPGTYTATAILSDPDAGEPQSAQVQVEVPVVPREGLFLVGPILGRPAGADLVVRGGSPSETGAAATAVDSMGDGKSFQPLLIQELDAPTDVVVLTQVCFAGRKTRERESSILRTLRTADGRIVGTLDPVKIQLDGTEKIRCQNVLDVLPSRSVKRSGEYVFSASLEPRSTGGPESKLARFSVVLSPEKLPMQRQPSENATPQSKW